MGVKPPVWNEKEGRFEDVGPDYRVRHTLKAFKFAPYKSRPSWVNKYIDKHSGKKCEDEYYKFRTTSHTDIFIEEGQWVFVNPITQELSVMTDHEFRSTFEEVVDE